MALMMKLTSSKTGKPEYVSLTDVGRLNVVDAKEKTPAHTEVHIKGLSEPVTVTESPEFILQTAGGYSQGMALVKQ